MNPYPDIIAALDQGDYATARTLLHPLLSAEPTAETLYLAARAALSDEQRLRFLNRALAYDPHHAKALAYKAQLRRINAPLTEEADPNPTTSATATSGSSSRTGMIVMGVLGVLFFMALMSSQDFAAQSAARAPTPLPPTVVPTRTPTLTPIPVRTPTPRPLRTATPVAGTANQTNLNSFIPAGTLAITSSTSMPLVGYPERIRDAAIRVRWKNPTVLNNALWDVGVLFRHTAEQHGYHLALISNGTWRLYLDPRGEPIAQGTASLRLEREAENWLELFVVDTQGWLIVNNQFVAVLPLTANQSSGFIFLATGFFGDTRVVGRSLAYRDVAITSLSDRAGPLSGDLIKAVEGRVALSDFATSARDGFVTSLFSNPDRVALWDYGVAFRLTDTAQYRLILRSNGVWQLLLRRDGASTVVQEGTWSPRERNRLQLIADGSSGWLTINNEPVGRLDLSALTTSGAVRLGAGFFNGNSLEIGQRIRFEDATVIRFPNR